VLLRPPALVWLLAATACGSHAPPVVRRDTATPSPGATACAPPARVAVGERLGEDRESRLIVFTTAGGKRVWTGPEGSGRVAAVWSPDGRRLAYMVDDDLMVHEDGRADRLAIAGVIGEASPIATFGPAGRYLAARTDDGVVVADLEHGTALSPRIIATGIACEADGLAWRGDADQLWALCRSESPDLLIWDAGDHSLRAFDHPEATGLLGWRAVAPAGMLALAEGGPLLIGVDGRRLDLPPPAGALGHLVGAAAVAGVLVYSDLDEDEGTERTLWLGRGRDEAPWPWLAGLVFDLSITPDATWAAFVVPDDRDAEAGDVYLARVGDHQVRPILELERLGALVGELADDDGEFGAPEGEDAPDDDDGDDDYQPPYDPTEVRELIGYHHPVLQPVAGGACRPRFPLGRERLVARQVRADQGGISLEEGGVVVRSGDDGDRVAFAGGAAGPLLPAGWREVRGIAADHLLVETGSGVELLAADGAGLASLAGARLAEVTADPEGALVWQRGPREIELYDPDGHRRRVHTTSADTRLALPVPGGGLLVAETGDRAELVSATGASLASFPAYDQVVAVLDDGGVVALTDEEGEDDDRLVLVFHAADGRQRGRAELSSQDSASLRLLPLAGHRVALIDDGEARISFYDAGGRELGSFFTGVGLDEAVAALPDGGVVIGAERVLWLVGADGTYLGGHVLPEPIDGGPYPVGAGRVVVRTESAIRVLERRPR